MKKEVNKVKTNILLKLFAALVIAASFFIVHAEYIMHKANNSSIFLRSRDTDISVDNTEKIDDTIELIEDELASDDIQAQLKVIEDDDIQPNILDKVDYYRIHLLQFSNLYTKFLQNIDYTKELQFLERNNTFYPEDVKVKLRALVSYYDNYLKLNNLEYEVVSSGDSVSSKLLTRMFDIKHKNPKYVTQVDEYERLLSTMRTLESWFFSVEFLKRYWSND